MPLYRLNQSDRCERYELPPYRGNARVRRVIEYSSMFPDVAGMKFVLGLPRPWAHGNENCTEIQHSENPSYEETGYRADGGAGRPWRW